jgi:formylglycine-generating enzyme required for sulfatase activity
MSAAAVAACSLSLDGFTGADDAGATPDASSDAIAPSGDDASMAADASDAGGERDADASDGACPSGRGPDMVRVPTGFCIDSTEVTTTQYAAFLASSPPFSDQPAECAWNTSFVPASAWPPAASEDAFPVRAVDWCDAFAFCAWSGKHLCGKVGGGSLPSADFASPALSQWMNACTQAGAHAYVYGDSYDATKCNGDVVDGGPEGGSIVAVKSFPSCQSYPGVYDLLGNLDEWEDSCNGTTGANDACRLRGEGYGEMTALRCDAPEAHVRSTSNDDQGIRCCAE